MPQRGWLTGSCWTELGPKSGPKITDPSAVLFFERIPRAAIHRNTYLEVGNLGREMTCQIFTVIRRIRPTKKKSDRRLTESFRIDFGARKSQILMLFSFLGRVGEFSTHLKVHVAI